MKKSSSESRLTTEFLSPCVRPSTLFGEAPVHSAIVVTSAIFGHGVITPVNNFGGKKSVVNLLPEVCPFNFWGHFFIISHRM